MLFKKNIQPAQLSDELFRKLRDFIYQRSGLKFADSKKKLLESRLQIRLKAKSLSSFQAYWDLLNTKDADKVELPLLFDAVTSWETRFFRSPSQLDVLTTEILPEILAEKAKQDDRKILIWSAGCSTGEEVYTLSILMNEFFAKQEEQWRVEILATDLSDAALKIARKGIYSSAGIRGVPPEYLEKCFTKIEGGQWKVNDEIKSKIAFRTLNFAHKARLSALSGINIIFCRNVITYFDSEFNDKLMNQLHNCLCLGGYLFLGPTESLLNISADFSIVKFPDTLVYKKE